MKKEQLFCYLIDDDEDDRDFFTTALYELDPDIKLGSATNAMEALERLKRTKDHVPDFIFLDLNMRPVDGKECLVELKKIPHLVDTPVIIYSTSISEAIIYNTLKMGAFDHIEKPAEKEMLVNYPRRVLQIAE